MNSIRVDVHELQQIAELLDVNIREMHSAIRTSCGQIVSITNSSSKMNVIKDSARVLQLQNEKLISEGYEVSKFLKDTAYRFQKVEDELLLFFRSTDEYTSRAVVDTNESIINNISSIVVSVIPVSTTRLPRAIPVLAGAALWAIRAWYTRRTLITVVTFVAARSTASRAFIRAQEKILRRLPNLGRTEITRLNDAIGRFMTQTPTQPKDIVIYLIGEMLESGKFTREAAMALALMYMNEYFRIKADKIREKERSKLQKLKQEQSYAAQQAQHFNQVYRSARNPAAKRRAYENWKYWHHKNQSLLNQVSEQARAVTRAENNLNEIVVKDKAKRWLKKYVDRMLR